MYDLEKLFKSLNRSKFRSSFKLNDQELFYLYDRGFDKVIQHAYEFVKRRLAPANPRNEGRQTPFGKHPVFVAQHATATCCRSCLEKWHSIEKGRALKEEEIEYIVRVIKRWIAEQLKVGHKNSD